MEEEIAINVHLWWEHRIRKVTIKDEIPELQLTVDRDGKEEHIKINKRENLEEFVRMTFIGQ